MLSINIKYEKSFQEYPQRVLIRCVKSFGQISEGYIKFLKPLFTIVHKDSKKREFFDGILNLFEVMFIRQMIYSF